MKPKTHHLILSSWVGRICLHPHHGAGQITRPIQTKEHAREHYMVREIIKLKSTESDDMRWTTKNKKKGGERLEIKKFDKKLRKRVTFRESK